jgi:hypothetical protein
VVAGVLEEAIGEVVAGVLEEAIGSSKRDGRR